MEKKFHVSIRKIAKNKNVTNCLNELLRDLSKLMIF